MAFRSLLLVSVISRCINGWSFINSGLLTQEDVAASIKAQSTLARQGSKEIQALQEAIRPTFTSMPKDKRRKVSSQEARYILHRMFAQRHGWFLRGLEPKNASWHGLHPETVEVKEWIPDYVQEQLGGSMDLPGLALFAAILIDLVKKETVGRLKIAFDVQGLGLQRSIDIEDVDDVIRTYYVAFLVGGNVSAKDRQDMDRKKAFFAKKYSGWTEAERWLAELQSSKYVPDKADQHTFGSTMSLATKLGEEYYKFNDLECRALKNELQDLEFNKAGRVRLSTFYQRANFSHWKFLEKADYLRTLGALDDSDPAQPQVITANYVMSRPNCLESSNMYAICCRNECEDLMGHIEREIKSSTALPERIIEIVSALPSDTVEAPRSLSPALIARLQQVQAVDGGEIPLHGRLFAQWLHHAYPRECPYPHLTGTTSPQTAEEWMQETGQSGSTVSQQEMEAQISSDKCIGASGQVIDCDEEAKGSSELPWSELEELMPVDQPEYQSHHRDVFLGAGTSSFFFWEQLLVAVAGLSLLTVAAGTAFFLVRHSSAWQPDLPAIMQKLEV